MFTPNIAIKWQKESVRERSQRCQERIEKERIKYQEDRVNLPIEISDNSSNIAENLNHVVTTSANSNPALTDDTVDDIRDDVLPVSEG